jgi:mannose-6-phosphate isomerase-like protein (cupin superfamily)
MKRFVKIAFACFSAGLCAKLMLGQDAPAGRGGKGKNKGPLQQWYVEKTDGGVYTPPNRPMWKLSELKAKHSGQSIWQEQIILDLEQDATYNAAVPGTKFQARMHPDTGTLFVVTAGNVHFAVEGQPEVNGRRGSIIHILKGTLFSYEVTSDQPAYWVEVNPPNYKTVYPVDGPAPKAVKSGGAIVKVAFNHTPAAYTPPNQLEFNTFDDMIAKCLPAGPRAINDHLFASPLLGWVNADDNKCGTGNGNIGSGPAKAGDPTFNPNSTFGHMHAGPAEWWIVQAGKIAGKFEKVGEFHAEEGDVLYAAPMTWHQMAAEALSGPSVRLAMGGYQLINMNNTLTAVGAQ